MTTRRKKSAAQLDAEISAAVHERVASREVPRALSLARGFNRFRHLPPDERLGNPLRSWGAVHASKLGSYWTTVVDVPVDDLFGLHPVLASKARLTSVTSARKGGVPLPPLEIGVYRDGSAWIVDGNHRLIDARRAGLATIPVTFTFAGT